MPRRRRPPRPGALSDLSPTRILTQIAILQAAFYACAVILLTFSAFAAGKQPGLDLLWNWQVLRGDVVEGWMYGLVWMLNSLVCVIFLLLLIARSKLVPDFALTIHFLHLVAVSLYSRSLPRNVFWWGLQLASAALMTGLGIWSCQWRELRPFSFGDAAHAASSAANGSILKDTFGLGGRGRRAHDDDDAASSAYAMSPIRT